MDPPDVPFGGARMETGVSSYSKHRWNGRMTTPRTTKTALNEQFARIGKALASPRRIELLDLLAQGEHSVEVLASETDMSVTLTSSHLQALRQARMVETRGEGARIYYRPAGDDVYELLSALRAVAHARLAEVDRVVRAYFGAP